MLRPRHIATLCTAKPGLRLASPSTCCRKMLAFSTTISVCSPFGHPRTTRILIILRFHTVAPQPRHLRLRSDVLISVCIAPELQPKTLTGTDNSPFHGSSVVSPRTTFARASLPLLLRICIRRPSTHCENTISRHNYLLFPLLRRIITWPHVPLPSSRSFAPFA